MTREQVYKEKVCTNCANDKCKNKIKVIRTQDVCIEQISTTTITKCNDFICKEKRKKKKNTSILARMVKMNINQNINK